MMRIEGTGLHVTGSQPEGLLRLSDLIAGRLRAGSAPKNPQRVCCCHTMVVGRQCQKGCYEGRDCAARCSDALQHRMAVGHLQHAIPTNDLDRTPHSQYPLSRDHLIRTYQANRL